MLLAKLLGWRPWLLHLNGLDLQLVHVDRDIGDTVHHPNTNTLSSKEYDEVPAHLARLQVLEVHDIAHDVLLLVTNIQVIIAA